VTAISCGALLAFDLALWNTALLRSPAADVALLVNNAPLWVGLMGWWFGHEKPTSRYWLGLCFSLAGVWALVGCAVPSSLFAGGAGLASMSACLYAGYLFLAQRARVHIDTVAFVTIVTVVGSGCLLAVCLASDLPLTGFTARAWLAMCGLGLLGHFAGWLATSYALGYIRASKVSVVLLAQAPITAILAIPLFGEVISPPQVAGGALVLAGVLFVSMARDSNPGRLQSASESRAFVES